MSFTKKQKEQIFDNAQGHCEKCNKQIVRNNHEEGQRGSWDAHHRTSVSSGGSDSVSNGQALCLECHKETRTYGKKKHN